MLALRDLTIGRVFDPRDLARFTVGGNPPSNPKVQHAAPLVQGAAFVPVPGPSSATENATIDFDLLVATTLAI